MFNSLVRAREWYFTLPRLQFEAITLGLAVLVGLLIMPAFIYLAGVAMLQPYAHGGFFALYFDLYKGLFEGRSSFWLVVLGPYAFLILLRVFRWILRKI